MFRTLKTSLREFHRSAFKFQKCSTKSLSAPWKILFFGTDNFALASLKPLCAKYRTGTLISDLGVVSKEGSLVDKFSKDEKLKCHRWPIKAEDIKSAYDIGMVVSFGHLIPKDLIESFPLGCINVHASILPRWRGAAPIIHAVMNGDVETGVTVMKIRPHKFDIGDIVRQYRIPIGLDETSEKLENRLAFYGSQLLMEVIRDLPRCVQMSTPQPQKGITYAPKIDSTLSIVRWEKLSAKNVYDLHRALGTIFPLKTSWGTNKLKLTSIEMDKQIKITDKSSSDETKLRQSALEFLNEGSDRKKSFANPDAGKFEFCKETKCLKVKCADGNFVVVKSLKVAGKNLSALDFYNGFLSKNSKETWIFGVT